MTPTAMQLEFRLDQRRRWFDNEWFFKWHHIGGRNVIEIDTFDGRHARYAGIKFSGSPHNVYWDAITRGARKEVVEQFEWIEKRVRSYARVQAEKAIDESAELLAQFCQALRRAAIWKDRILRGDGMNFPPEHDFGNWSAISREEIVRQAAALKEALFPAEYVLSLQPVAQTSNARTPTQSYQVALSFAGEQRDYVDQVARALYMRGIKVFYDRFETIRLWGKDGTEFFHHQRL